MRAEIISKLEERGIDFDQLRSSSNQPDADPFDLLCHLAFNGPLRTRRERADRVKKEEKNFFQKYGPEARAILGDLLEKYADHGTAQFVIPDVLKVPPIADRGNVIEIARLFGVGSAHAGQFFDPRHDPPLMGIRYVTANRLSQQGILEKFLVSRCPRCGMVELTSVILKQFL
jgi:EcoEI R protein C-terminal